MGKQEHLKIEWHYNPGIQAKNQSQIIEEYTSHTANFARVRIAIYSMYGETESEIN